jgi:hypothetical protein
MTTLADDLRRQVHHDDGTSLQTLRLLGEAVDEIERLGSLARSAAELILYLQTKLDRGLTPLPEGHTSGRGLTITLLETCSSASATSAYERSAIHMCMYMAEPLM